MPTLTIKQANRIARFIGTARDPHETDEVWCFRIEGMVHEMWEQLGVLERESADLRRRLRSVMKVMLPEGP